MHGGGEVYYPKVQNPMLGICDIKEIFTTLIRPVKSIIRYVTLASSLLLDVSIVLVEL